MASDSSNPPGDDRSDEAIPELVNLRETPSEGFHERVRGGILRRLFAADAIEFSFLAFFQTALSYLTTLIDAVLGKSDAQEREPE